MICLICNKDFSSVCHHVKAHGRTAREYKREFDIPISTSLDDEPLRKARSEAAKKTVSKKHLVMMRNISRKKRAVSAKERKIEPYLEDTDAVMLRREDLKVVQGSLIDFARFSAMGYAKLVNRTEDAIKIVNEALTQTEVTT